jgi:hypothetical protein
MLKISYPESKEFKDLFLDSYKGLYDSYRHWKSEREDDEGGLHYRDYSMVFAVFYDPKEIRIDAGSMPSKGIEIGSKRYKINELTNFLCFGSEIFDIYKSLSINN